MSESDYRSEFRIVVDRYMHLSVDNDITYIIGGSMLSYHGYCCGHGDYFAKVIFKHNEERDTIRIVNLLKADNNIFNFMDFTTFYINE